MDWNSDGIEAFDYDYIEGIVKGWTLNVHYGNPIDPDFKRDASKKQPFALLKAGAEDFLRQHGLVSRFESRMEQELSDGILHHLIKVDCYIHINSHDGLVIGHAQGSSDSFEPRFGEAPARCTGCGMRSIQKTYSGWTSKKAWECSKFKGGKCEATFPVETYFGKEVEAITANTPNILRFASKRALLAAVQQLGFSSYFGVAAAKGGYGSYTYLSKERAANRPPTVDPFATAPKAAPKPAPAPVVERPLPPLPDPFKAEEPASKGAPVVGAKISDLLDAVSFAVQKMGELTGKTKDEVTARLFPQEKYPGGMDQLWKMELDEVVAEHGRVLKSLEDTVTWAQKQPKAKPAPQKAMF